MNITLDFVDEYGKIDDFITNLLNLELIQLFCEKLASVYVYSINECSFQYRCINEPFDSYTILFQIKRNDIYLKLSINLHLRIVINFEGNNEEIYNQHFEILKSIIKVFEERRKLKVVFSIVN